MFLPDPAVSGEPVLQRGPRLHPEERDAVLLAHADARRAGWDGGRGGRLHRLLGILIRAAPVAPLPDPRLERLRLFGCTMRRGDPRSGALAEALLADGFSEAALREALGLALG